LRLTGKVWSVDWALGGKHTEVEGLIEQDFVYLDIEQRADQLTDYPVCETGEGVFTWLQLSFAHGSACDRLVDHCIG